MDVASMCYPSVGYEIHGSSSSKTSSTTVQIPSPILIPSGSSPNNALTPKPYLSRNENSHQPSFNRCESPPLPTQPLHNDVRLPPIVENLQQNSNDVRQSSPFPNFATHHQPSTPRQSSAKPIQPGSHINNDSNNQYPSVWSRQMPHNVAGGPFFDQPQQPQDTQIPQPPQHEIKQTQQRYEYHYSPPQFNKEQQQQSWPIEKNADLDKVVEHCNVIGQFATQYCGESNTNKSGGAFSTNTWHHASSSSSTTLSLSQFSVSSEKTINEMLARACEVVNVLTSMKNDLCNNNNRSDEMTEVDKMDNIIRNKRPSITVSPRTKYRKRSKRAAPPGRCHSCNISETPEWRRGPDGARTLCNACGLQSSPVIIAPAPTLQNSTDPMAMSKSTRVSAIILDREQRSKRSRIEPRVEQDNLHRLVTMKGEEDHESSRRLS
ncbi:4907_t:CDS:2 [Ambispora gerdemannii]|uniref:4907_t:CDS:1 n=1 Tax=Ambispora gerdemannii TaxID=144530 RepID=A0A9N9AY71_9GLOM|nr:4907_t:CDS:2 [Ambispora gerdemannii]